MSKGDNKREMLERFKSMGIPTPVEPVKNVQKAAANPEMASKMEQIRNGALRGQYAKFIEKGETVSKAPTSLPVPKVGQKPGNNTPPPANLSKPSTTSNPQAQMLENIMFGDSGAPTTSTAFSTDNIEEYGPTVDTRTRLKQRLEQKEVQVQDEGYMQYASNTQSQGANINYDELDNRIVEIATEVAKNVSKNMVKQVLMEYAKSGKGVILESKTVRKAEIVGKNKVKIGGKVFKLTPVSE
jgi:hypothetical protein